VAILPVAVPVDGQIATGLLYEPYLCRRGDIRSRALVMFAHGHGDTASTEGRYLKALAVTSRVPVIAMNNRGTPGAWNPTTGYQDTNAAALWYLHAHPGTRTTIIWGWSMGGIASGMAIGYGPRHLYDYWVASFPVVNDFGAWMVFTGLHSSTEQEIEHDAGGCNPVQCPANYEARSPSMFASRIDVRHAILLQGLFDDNSPYEQTREMQSALVAAHVPVSEYTVTTSREPSTGQNVVKLPAGLPQPAGHGAGPVADEALGVVERLLAGTEPLSGADREYVVDQTTGVGTAPGQ